MDNQYHIDPEINKVLIAIGSHIKKWQQSNPNEKSNSAHVIIIPKNQEENIYACSTSSSGEWTLINNNAIEDYCTRLIKERRLEGFQKVIDEITKLNNLLCDFERSTSREYLFIAMSNKDYKALKKYEGLLMITRNGNPEYPNKNFSAIEVIHYFLIERNNE